MHIVPKTKILSWTLHARAKMNFYRLSPARIRRVLHSPKRIEEGVAPNTVAMMQPGSIKSSSGRTGAEKKETWTQEIWVMVQDAGSTRKVISAWRYPGMTKPSSAVTLDLMQKEYREFLSR